MPDGRRREKKTKAKCFFPMFDEMWKNAYVQGTDLKANVRKAPCCIRERGEGFTTIRVMFTVSKFAPFTSLPRICF
jgi:hypothetical protein